MMQANNLNPPQKDKDAIGRAWRSKAAHEVCV